MFAPLYENSKGHWNRLVLAVFLAVFHDLLLNDARTIHGMVYNAMKLFMEINPQLFDDCSHEYTELQNSAGKREQSRQEKWDKLAEQAKRMKSGNPPPANPNTDIMGSYGKARVDELDPMTQDSQKRLDALKLQDESASKERRHQDPQNSVSSS